VSGAWAEEKLEALRRYLNVVLTAMRTSEGWKGCCYVDLLAGGGRCILENGHEFDGSPIIALRSSLPFARVVLVEEHPKLAAALRARTLNDLNPAPSIIEGDCNEPTTLRSVLEAIPRNMLTIAFVDNLGWEVRLSTISKLASNRRMDLVVTFQTSAFKRNVSRALKEPNIEQQFNSYLGVGWRRAVADFEARKTTAPDVGAALADYYTERLKNLGYRYAQPLYQPMKNTRNAELYRVLLFSKHPLGKRLFGAVSKSIAPPTLDFGEG